MAANIFHISETMGAWQGVDIDSLNFHSGPPCMTLLRPVGGLPLKRPDNLFRSGPPAREAACTPHAVRLCRKLRHETKPSDSVSWGSQVTERAEGVWSYGCLDA
jgi:hypothetical protein